MKRLLLPKVPLILAIISVAFLIAAGASNGSDHYTTLVVIGTVAILLSALTFILLSKKGYLK